MKKAYLFHVNYKIKFGDILQQWLPYSVGCLWSYAMENKRLKENWELSDIFYERETIENVLDNIESPDICAFSVLIWNREWSLKVAEEIKKKWPTTKIVVGGPEPDESWIKYDFIDSIVIGEGEITFSKILEDILDDIPLDRVYKVERALNLESAPSPYLTGVFDDIMSRNPEVHWQMTLETNRGCPYACTYCDWGGLTASKVKKFKLEKVLAEIEWIKDKKISVIFLADANLGIFKERDLEIAKILGKAAKEHKYLEFISNDYAKNNTEHCFKVCEAIGKDYSRGVTLALQTSNEDTLKAIKRNNMKSNDAKRAIELAKKYDTNYYTEFILGLPLETITSWKKGITDLIDLGHQGLIEFNTAMILPNTEMNRKQRTEYNLRTVPVYDFVKFAQDDSNIEEHVDVVVSTSTMRMDEIIDAYLFGWINQIFHVHEYTRLISSYFRNCLNMSYNTFYMSLQEEIENSENNVVKNAYQSVYNGVYNTYTIGRTLLPDCDQGSLVHYKLDYLNENIEKVFVFLNNFVEKLGGNTQIVNLQKYMMKNDKINSNLPVTIEFDYDIDTWEKIECVYTIYPKEKKENQLWRSRRVNHDYKTIEKVIKTEIKNETI